MPFYGDSDNRVEITALKRYSAAWKNSRAVVSVLDVADLARHEVVVPSKKKARLDLRTGAVHRPPSIRKVTWTLVEDRARKLGDIGGDDEEVPLDPAEPGARLALNERFRNQPTSYWRYGTGFFVAPKVIATAGHVIAGITRDDVPDITEAKFVLGFDMINGAARSTFLDTHVYGGVRTIRAPGANQHAEAEDWALVQTDRACVIEPVVLSTDPDLPPVGSSIYCIGHPNSLPAKMTYGKVAAHNGACFVAHIDTYASNSGSPVFDSETHAVVGILVSGTADWTLNENQSLRALRAPKKNDLGGASGEVVLGIHPVYRKLLADGVQIRVDRVRPLRI